MRGAGLRVRSARPAQQTGVTAPPVPDALDHQFRRLLDAHGGVLWRVAGAYTRTRPDREDLYQDMLLHVWRALPSFRGDAAERTWVTRIAFNVALGAVRRRTVRATVDAPAAVERAPSGGPDPADHAASADALGQLWAAVRQLSEVDRALVLLCSKTARTPRSPTSWA